MPGRVGRVNRKPPEPWAQWMRDANIGDPRNGEPSYQALARATGLGAETVRKLALGQGRPSEHTLRQVAGAIQKDVRVVAKAAGLAREIREPYEPPDEAHGLDRIERDAIDQIIRLLARARTLGVEDEAGLYPHAADLPPTRSDTEVPRQWAARKAPPASRRPRSH
jgi:transcriptional regulator with XRE-family HTH domain